MTAGSGWRWLYLVVALCAAAGVVCFWLLPFSSILRDFSSDDSFYYSQTARILALHGHSSLDGVNRTNGYHPLWLLLQVPLFWLPLGDESAIRATRSLEVLLAFGGCAAFLAFLRRAGVRPWVALPILLFFLRQRVLYIGMEAAANIACLCVAAWTLGALSRAPETSRARRARWAGAALAACFLARIDNLAFAAAATLLVAGSRTFRLGRREKLWLIGPQLAVVLGYFAGNAIWFGTPVPVSGLVKQWWSAASVSESWLSVFWNRLGENLGHSAVRDGLLWGGGAAIVFAISARRRQREGEEARVQRGLGLFVLALLALNVAKLLYYSATVTPGLGNYLWYHVPARFARYVTLVYAAHELTRTPAVHSRLDRHGRIRRTIAALIVGGVLVLGGRYLTDHGRTVARQELDWEILSYHGARWIRANTAPGTRIGSYDAGVLSYFAHRPVTNLDGLMNSAEYLDVLQHTGVEDYLRRQGIGLLGNVVAEPQAFLREKGLTADPAGPFQVVYLDRQRSAFVDGAHRRFSVIAFRR